MNRQSYPKGSTGMRQFIYELRQLQHQARVYVINKSIAKECKRHAEMMRDILECLHEANDPKQS